MIDFIVLYMVSRYFYCLWFQVNILMLRLFKTPQTCNMPRVWRPPCPPPLWHCSQCRNCIDLSTCVKLNRITVVTKPTSFCSPLWAVVFQLLSALHEMILSDYVLHLPRDIHLQRLCKHSSRIEIEMADCENVTSLIVKSLKPWDKYCHWINIRWQYGHALS